MVGAAVGAGVVRELPRDGLVGPPPGLGLDGGAAAVHQVGVRGVGHVVALGRVGVDQRLAVVLVGDDVAEVRERADVVELVAVLGQDLQDVGLGAALGAGVDAVARRAEPDDEVAAELLELAAAPGAEEGGEQNEGSTADTGDEGLAIHARSPNACSDGLRVRRIDELINYTITFR